MQRSLNIKCNEIKNTSISVDQLFIIFCDTNKINKKFGLFDKILNNTLFYYSIFLNLIYIELYIFMFIKGLLNWLNFVEFRRAI